MEQQQQLFCAHAVMEAGMLVYLTSNLSLCSVVCLPSHLAAEDGVSVPDAFYHALHALSAAPAPPH